MDKISFRQNPPHLNWQTNLSQFERRGLCQDGILSVIRTNKLKLDLHLRLTNERMYIPGELGVVWYGELAALYREGALPER